MMFVDCPAYLDQDGAARCGLPAEVRCPAGHWFTGPIEFLTPAPEPGRAAAPPCLAETDGGRKERPPW